MWVFDAQNTSRLSHHTSCHHTRIQGAYKLGVEIGNSVIHAPGDIDRFEACLSGTIYAPHRHDTYTIGITLNGVQSFDFRGKTRHSLPGQMVVLHPDELHDGRAGTDAAFRYRAINIAPETIQGILGGKVLPFVKNGISTDKRLRKAIDQLLSDYTRALDWLEYHDALYDLAIALEAISGAAQGRKIVNYAAANTARVYLNDNLQRNVSLEELEQVTRYDRWQLSRDFRLAFGTSPYRYMIMRKLNKARFLILSGDTFAAAAAECCFSDQSHFTRHFRKAYGLTPKVWMKMATH